MQTDLALPMMIPLSIPEARRIFYSLVGTLSFSSLYRLTWSYWRRTHQAIARLCHYKRRIACVTTTVGLAPITHINPLKKTRKFLWHLKNYLVEHVDTRFQNVFIST
jgi:hypothetical protein